MVRSAAPRLCLAVVALCVLVPAVSAGPARLVTIDYPNADATYALGINPAGDVVGGYDAGGKESAFLLRNGVFTSYDHPDATWTEFERINAEGDIVGLYGAPNGSTQGFLLRDAQVTPIVVGGFVNSMPFGIADDGTIVGCAHGSPTGMHGFRRTPGGVIEVQGPAGSMHTAINPAGVIVGYKGAASYVIHEGVVSWFSVPGAAATQAWGIGATGDIVGLSFDGTGTHTFLLREGVYSSLDLADATQTTVWDINPGGDVVGYYTDATGCHGFVKRTR